MKRSHVLLALLFFPLASCIADAEAQTTVPSRSSGSTCGDGGQCQERLDAAAVTNPLIGDGAVNQGNLAGSLQNAIPFKNEAGVIEGYLTGSSAITTVCYADGGLNDGAPCLTQRGKLAFGPSQFQLADDPADAQTVVQLNTLGSGQPVGSSMLDLPDATFIPTRIRATGGYTTTADAGYKIPGCSISLPINEECTFRVRWEVAQVTSIDAASPVTHGGEVCRWFRSLTNHGGTNAETNTVTCHTDWTSTITGMSAGIQYDGQVAEPWFQGIAGGNLRVSCEIAELSCTSH